MVGSSSNQTQNVKYNTPTAVVGNQLTDGTEFIVIARSRQSQDLQVWSSGDPEQTQSMFREARSTIDSLQPTS